MIDATERRRKELDQPKPPAFFLYVDQGEELYVRAEEHQRRRFSELLAQALPEPRLRTMMSMRSDFLGSLQNDEPLFKARQQIDVPPLGEGELREVVSRPAQLLAARFESEGLIDIISRRTAEDSVKDVGALPLLSYTLDDMWTQWCVETTGRCAFRRNPSSLAACSSTVPTRFWRRIRGPKLPCGAFSLCGSATVREDGEPTRRRAARGSFQTRSGGSSASWPTIPIGSLVTATTETGETYAEVAHEAIFRRWDKLREWVSAEREFLAWRSGLEAARAPGRRRRTPRSMTPCLWARR